jgi:prepilin-type N-terminal cleavage/methylation domain-containing protein
LAGRGRGPVRGFTAVELITVLILVGVLAVVAMPRLDAGLSLRGAAWRDQVLAGLMQARSQAQGHRRLVCVTLATGAVRLAIASANPASACDTVIKGPDGDARWAYDGNGFTLTQSPAGTLYFQPDGRITRDGAGSSAVNVSIALAGETGLQLTGETGHVR